MTGVDATEPVGHADPEDEPGATSAAGPVDAPTGPRATHPPGYVDAEDKQKVLARLRRVEGQVRGLQRLVDEDAYCIDVLTQVAAVTGALQGVAMTLVRDHVQHCVTDDLRDGDRTSLDEVMQAIQRLVR